MQGRWGASARLAFVRLLKSPTDPSGGEPLAKQSPGTFPTIDYFDQWGNLFNSIWEQHVNNVIKFVPGFSGFYRLDAAAEKQMIRAIADHLDSLTDKRLFDGGMGLLQWSLSNIEAFAHFTVRAFLRNDSYNAMTEFLSRADGSFGIQAHSTLEPGSVTIASKGQPMSLSYDPDLSMCLFGSEAAAVAVPVESTGTWLCNRLDLDSKGEITRIGRPRPMLEGTFQYSTAGISDSKGPSSVVATGTGQARVPGLWLHNGIQILSYSLLAAREYTAIELLERASPIDAAPIPYDPSVDLVGGDIAMTPAIIQAIENGVSLFHDVVLTLSNR